MSQKHDELSADSTKLFVLKKYIEKKQEGIKQQTNKITGYITGLLYHRGLGIKAYAVNMFRASAMDQKKITDESIHTDHGHDIEAHKYMKPDSKIISDIAEIENTMNKIAGNVGNKVLGVWNMYRKLNPLQKPFQKIETLESPDDFDFLNSVTTLAWDKTAGDAASVVVTPVKAPRVDDTAKIEAEVSKFQQKYNKITAGVARSWYDKIVCHRNLAYNQFQTSVIVICLESFENLTLPEFFSVTKRLVHIYDHRNIRETPDKTARARYQKEITDIVRSKCEGETLSYFNHLQTRTKYNEYSDDNIEGHQWAEKLFASVHGL